MKGSSVAEFQGLRMPGRHDVSISGLEGYRVSGLGIQGFRVSEFEYHFTLTVTADYSS